MSTCCSSLVFVLPDRLSLPLATGTCGVVAWIAGSAPFWRLGFGSAWRACAWCTAQTRCRSTTSLSPGEIDFLPSTLVLFYPLIFILYSLTKLCSLWHLPICVVSLYPLILSEVLLAPQSGDTLHDRLPEMLAVIVYVHCTMLVRYRRLYGNFVSSYTSILRMRLSQAY